MTTQRVGRAFVAGYAALVAAALVTDYLLYADGSYFVFALGSRHPWELLWGNFAHRLGAALLTGLPAGVAAELGAPIVVVSKLYQATFLLLPVLAFAAARRLEAVGETRWHRWSILTMSTLGLIVFGFPTETVVSLVLVFPLMAGIAAPIERPARLVAVMALSAVFVFSHEVALLCAPAMLLALWRAWRRPGQDRRYLVALLAWWIACWLAWWLIGWRIVPSNPMTVPALAQNASAYSHLGQFTERPLFRVGLLGIALMCWFTWRPRGLRSRGVQVAVLAVAAASAAYCLPDTWPGDHYDCRVAIAIALPVVAAIALYLPAPPLPLVGLALAFLAAHAIVAGHGILGWVTYRRTLTTQLAHHATYTADDWNAFARDALPSYAQGFFWSWTEPYLSTLLTAGRTGTVLVDRDSWYVPMTCPAAHRVLPELSWLRRHDVEQLIDDVCDKSATVEAFCEGELLAGDVDGDGNVDLVCRERRPGGGLRIAYGISGGLAGARGWSGDLSWCRSPGSALLIGSFGRDHRSGLVCHDPGSGSIAVALPSAEGSFASPTWRSAEADAWCKGRDAELVLGDFDADGRDDLLCHDKRSGALAIRVASGDPGLERFIDRWQDPDAHWCVDPGDRLVAGDVDRDGIDEVLCHRSANGATWVTFELIPRSETRSPIAKHATWTGTTQRCTAGPDHLWLHDRDGDGAADVMCQTRDRGLLRVASSTRDRSAPYLGTTRERFGAGWCYGGGGIDDRGRHLVDVGCVQRAWHPR